MYEQNLERWTATAGMKLSVVMPAQNEEGSVGATVEGVVAALEREGIDYEVIVVNDDSEDSTEAVVDAIGAANPRVRCHRSHYERGFGMAIRAGLDVFEGDAVAIVMADASDDPEDLVRYHRLLEEGWDCAFGSRFMPGAQVHDYPRLKLPINRLANQFIRILFRHRYNDTTNAFKAYRREVIETIQPLLSKHFNLTVEMPLKAIVRGHTYAVVPTCWTNRTSGEAKLAMKEMGSRYLFIVLYVWLESTLSRGDYQVRKAERRAPLDRPDASRLSRSSVLAADHQELLAEQLPGQRRLQVESGSARRGRQDAAEGVGQVAGDHPLELEAGGVEVLADRDVGQRDVVVGAVPVLVGAVAVVRPHDRDPAALLHRAVHLFEEGGDRLLVVEVLEEVGDEDAVEVVRRAARRP